MVDPTARVVCGTDLFAACPGTAPGDRIADTTSKDADGAPVLRVAGRGAGERVAHRLAASTWGEGEGVLVEVS